MDEEKDEADDEEVYIQDDEIIEAQTEVEHAKQHDGDALHATFPAGTNARDIVRPPMLEIFNPPQDGGFLAERGLLSVAARLGQAAASVVSPRNILDSVVDEIISRAPVPTGPAANPAAVVPTEQLEQDPVETIGPGAMSAVVHIEQPEQSPVNEEDIDA